MKIYKVMWKFDLSNPTYVVCNELKDVQELTDKDYPESTIHSVELISENVINMWAQ